MSCYSVGCPLSGNSPNVYCKYIVCLPHIHLLQVTCGEDGAVYMWDYNSDGDQPEDVTFAAEQQDKISAVKIVDLGNVRASSAVKRLRFGRSSNQWIGL